MSSEEDLRKTRTRPFATTIAAESEPGSARGTGGRDEEAGELPGVGDVVGLHYRLVRLLGEGNFGKVYVAERVDVPEHRVALKILPRSFYIGRNVERELVMLATVGHPHVVQLKDHGMTAEYVWLTMPVYEGETLEERLDRGPLSLREAYDIFLPIARSLEALHNAGLRHQDVKPDNIFLAKFGGRLHPVLLDLGVAAERESTFVAGTALYAAPEQLAAILNIEKNPPLSEKMDTYGFAATLLLSLVGDKAFPGSRAMTRRQVIDSHEQRAQNPLGEDSLPDLLPSVRKDMNACFARWMALKEEDRPSMSGVADELEILLEPERAEAREEELARQRQRRSLARARIGVLMVLLAASAIGGVALWKRETLRLAGELEQARAKGAESFDKLDTCVAGHAVARREAQVCSQDLEREKAEHEKTLGSLAKQGEGCAEAVDQIRELRTTMTNEAKKHEDELKAEHNACASEREKLSGEYKTERSKLEAAQASCTTELASRESSLETLKAERDQCIAERDNVYGDKPVVASPTPTQTAAPTAQPTSTSAPTAQPTGTSAPTVPPTTTAAPTSPPVEPTPPPQNEATPDPYGG
jgi:hypothetical protein